ncbi:MAG: flippase-like domain-containing protein [Bacteroidetes bacterium]|nr:flippase-like domain-containing protein [Bacteroidota bacterium]
MRSVNFDDLVNELKKTNYFLAIAGGLVGVLIGSYFRALRWRYFLNPIKENISMKNLFPPIMIGYMLNSVIPRGGEFTRPIILARNEDISKAASFGTILVERIFDVLSVLGAFGISLFAFRDKLGAAFPEYNVEKIALISSLGTLAVIVFIIVVIFNFEKSEHIIEKITSKFFPEKFQIKIKKFFSSTMSGFLFIKYPKDYLPIFIYTVLIWIMYLLSAYITFFACGINNLNLVDANLVLTMITFAMFLPLPGNSAGAFHYICTGTLVNIFGIDREVAFGYATVNHLTGFILQILIGAYYFFKENYKVKDLQS